SKYYYYYKWLNTLCVCLLIMPATYLISAPSLLRLGETGILDLPSVSVFSFVQLFLRWPVAGKRTFDHSYTKYDSHGCLLHPNYTERMNSMKQYSVVFLFKFPNSSVDQRYSLTLIVKGIQEGRLLFTNATALNFNPESFTTFIQTDKHNYRPGDTVRMRVLSVQPDGKPHSGSVDLSIRDPTGNLTLRWVSLASYLGVVSRDFHLPPTAPKGTWTISVTVDVGFTVILHCHYDQNNPRRHVVLDISDISSFTSHLVFPCRSCLIYICIQYSSNVKIYFPVFYQGLIINKTVDVHLTENTYRLEFYDVPHVLKPSLHFSTNVTSMGQVVAAGMATSSHFDLIPAVSWRPEACIIVYCVQHGEVINDAMDVFIKPDGVLKNQVSLSWSSKKVRPGEEVSLTVHVLEPGSLVGIMVVSAEDEDIDGDIAEGEVGDPDNNWTSSPASETTLLGVVKLVVFLHMPVPDSITSWRAVAFVMSENLGLGLTLKPQMVFDFSLSLDIPECITRGEQLVLEVNLFNHLEQDLEVIVWVAENQSFQGAVGDNDLFSTVIARTVTLKSKCGAATLFPIRPLVYGEIMMTVKAQAGQVSEEIVRRVLPEGKEQWFSETLFLEVPPSTRNLSRQLHFSFPQEVLPGSQRAHITVVGDVLGLSIAGLGSLVQMPHGSGEQNMIHFAPAVYVLQHLAQFNQSNEGIRGRALSLMMEGYQKELSFQRDDGSFSAFGDRDKSGSTWLTAFVLRCFLQAQSFMEIDQSVVTRALGWLVQQQRSYGEFVEVGTLINTELQGGLDGPVSLTAYVLMTFMFQANVSIAKTFLEDRVASGVSSNYSLCLVAYALSLANSRVADKVLTELMRRADFRGDTWRTSSVEVTDSWQPRAADIEMAAYVLLALNQQARIEEGFDLMKWLSQQRNHLGGYGSTQATVVALKALSVYAALSGAHAIDLEIEVSTSASPKLSHFIINSSNHLVNQNKEVEHLATYMSNKLTSTFSLVGQLNVFYSMKYKVLFEMSPANKEDESFSLDVKVIDDENDLDHIMLSVCTSLLASQRIAQTGMVLLEVGVLSGFTLAPNAVAVGDLIKKIVNASGKVILYLYSVKVCIKFPMIRVFKVSRVQDAVVQVYDYYEPRRRAVRSYNSKVMQELNLCAFCGRDCGLCRHEVLIGGSSTSSRQNSTIYCLGFVLVVIIALLLSAYCRNQYQKRASGLGGFCFYFQKRISMYKNVN
uniref:CD109 molecule n=1 Tax=Esox lucius TaxID=8010 RepID=A0AAY5JX40_ESOLU